MNGIGTSQLDLFLNFSDLHLLVFSPKWKLVDIHPGHRNFLGWSEINIDSFHFERNFLRPNQLSLQDFLGNFQHKEYLIKNFYWQDIEGHESGPYETYFRIKKERGQIKSLMAFVKSGVNQDRVCIPPVDKHLIFLGKMLPGLIHNINGPLGTLTGRVELLGYKYSEIEGLDEVLKMGFKIQSIIENLSFKVVNELYQQPIEVNLNRLLREEIKFLNCDLFFKHQVQKKENYADNIPQFRIYYLLISGIFSECYHFMRKFVDEDQEYIFNINSFFENNEVGFNIRFLGDFRIPEELDLHFPFSMQGNAVQFLQQNYDGIDSAFLAYCLKRNQGYLEITGRKELLTVRFTFPLPGTT